jgi:hypothetical protein
MDHGWHGGPKPAQRKSATDAWHNAPAMLKMVRLAEHIQWVEKHNALQEVAAFLWGLREDEWHHLGE